MKKNERSIDVEEMDTRIFMEKIKRAVKEINKGVCTFCIVINGESILPTVEARNTGFS
jgi:hypothetical protein